MTNLYYSNQHVWHKTDILLIQKKCINRKTDIYKQLLMSSAPIWIEAVCVMRLNPFLSTKAWNFPNLLLYRCQRHKPIGIHWLFWACYGVSGTNNHFFWLLILSILNQILWYSIFWANLFFKVQRNWLNFSLQNWLDLDRVMTTLVINTFFLFFLFINNWVEAQPFH